MRPSSDLFIFTVFVVASSIKLRILNSLALLQNDLFHGQKLYIDLIVPNLRNALARSIGQCKLCIVLNESVCHCYADNLKTVSVILPSRCQSNESQWLSLELRNCTNDPDNDELIKTTWLYIPSKFERSQGLSDFPADITKLTLVLPLHLNDLARSTILFESLSLTSQKHNDILEFLIFVPDEQHKVISKVISGIAPSLPFPVIVHRESVLFHYD